MRKKPGIRIFWPQYFDSERSWGMGRRLPKDLAIPLPLVQDLHKAALKLGYDAYVNPTAHYPKTWWDEPGCLLVDTMGQTKRYVMEKLVEEVQKIQQKRELEKAVKKRKKGKRKR